MISRLGCVCIEVKSTLWYFGSDCLWIWVVIVLIWIKAVDVTDGEVDMKLLLLGSQLWLSKDKCN